ncbi:hypothetical protein ACIBCN_19305 [Nocardia sp. NPDC051052]|uniref:hypothetical protein n=1 Tax=Nocardia sp. NPDC051052 TaxID=3364322 RepID=UPI00378E15A3
MSALPLIVAVHIAAWVVLRHLALRREICCARCHLVQIMPQYGGRAQMKGNLLMRREHIYDKIIEDHNRSVANSLTDQIFAARDDFFKFISTYGRTQMGLDEGEPLPVRSSLWNYVDCWLTELSPILYSNSGGGFLFDPREREAIWRQFLRHVPNIYLVICEAYDQDPSKLDLIERDPVTGKETRIERRVTKKLPVVEDSEFNTEEGDEPPTAEERERASVLELVTGIAEHWPLVTYGPDVMDGEPKHL